MAGRVERFVGARADPLNASVVGLAAFLLYLRTMAPSVACIFCDSLEFQLVTYKLGIAHPTGYPLYTLLGKLFTFLPLGDVAYRVNLMSAFFGALTVALLYLTMRLVLNFRLPALLGALVFAVSPVFWSQAVIAEVYTLNSMFVALTLFLLLRWKEAVEEDKGASLRPLALAYGLSLTHHRTMLLLAPAMAAFVLWVDRGLFKRDREWARLASLFLAPLLLYLYIPIRGVYTSSLDGTYVNTLSGFIKQVTAGGYGVFLTENPLGESRGLAFYFTLFRQQFTLVGLALGLLGLFWFTRRPKVLLLLGLAGVANFAFLLGYRVSDIEVFFIPLFLLWACFLGGGLALLWQGVMALWGRFSSLKGVPRSAYAAFLVLSGLLPLYLWGGNYDLVNLSKGWEAHDYGIDILSQPREEDAVVVGILGEMTLLRYFQETEGLRPEITTVAADEEATRLETVEGQLAAGHPVYLTRPLPGAEERWHLSALGPLIRVRERPAKIAVSPQVDSNISFGDFLLLLGYDSTFRESHSRMWVRVNLYWQALAETEEFLVSLRLVDSAGHLAGQVDSSPVHDAYPPDAWQPGETIVDSYDLPVLVGVPPGEYSLEVVLYRPQTLEEVGRAQLGKVVLPKSFDLPGVASLGVREVTRANFGNRLRLVGYSLVGEEFRPGDSVPLTFLWQGLGDLGGCSLSLWFQDESGCRWGERVLVLGGEYPSPIWERGQLVRQWQTLLVPADLPDGRYRLRMQVLKGEKPLSRLYWLLPLGSTFDLGTVEVKGRERSFALPPIEHPLDFRWGEVVRLLGYDLEPMEVESGGSLHLTLYWQALSTMETSYTVFIHLLDEERDLQGQRDSVPGEGSLPTTSWMTGEVITDRYDISIASGAPPGRYRLLVGMYEPVSGKRLPVYDGAGNGVGDSVTLEEVEVVSR
ncbi:MAG: DUF2723 domain-containing protein [Anaerolineae bacterium]